MAKKFDKTIDMENNLYIKLNCNFDSKMCSLIGVGAKSSESGEVVLNIPDKVSIEGESYFIKSIGWDTACGIEESGQISDMSIVLDIPNSVKTISPYAFMRTNCIKKITGMNSVEKIGKGAFMKSKVEEISWPDSCEKINAFTFQESALKKFIGTKGICQVETSAFGECNVEEVDLSKTRITILNIGKTFGRCSKIKKVTMPFFMTYELDDTSLRDLTAGFDVLSKGVLVKSAPKSYSPTLVTIRGHEFVITGTLSVKRADFERMITACGGYVSNRVTSSTAYLIVGDKPGNTKLKAGAAHCVPCVSEYDVRRSM